MSLLALCNDLVTLLRKTTATDSSLGAANTWTEVGTYPGTVQPVSESTRYTIGRRDVWVSHHLYMAQDIGATVRDKISHAGKEYLITAVRDMGGRHRAWRLDLVQQN